MTIKDNDKGTPQSRLKELETSILTMENESDTHHTHASLRWLGTFLCLAGIALTSLNIFPLNLFFGFTGSFLWSVVGIRQKDYALFVVESVAVLMYLYGIIIL